MPIWVAFFTSNLESIDWLIPISQMKTHSPAFVCGGGWRLQCLNQHKVWCRRAMPETDNYSVVWKGQYKNVFLEVRLVKRKGKVHRKGGAMKAGFWRIIRSSTGAARPKMGRCRIDICRAARYQSLGLLWRRVRTDEARTRRIYHTYCAGLLREHFQACPWLLAVELWRSEQV